MKMPFLKDDTKDAEKRAMHKKIQHEAWLIMKRVMMRKLYHKNVDALEKLYKSYFTRYPDAKAQAESMNRITKLRQFAK